MKLLISIILMFSALIADQKTISDGSYSCEVVAILNQHFKVSYVYPKGARAVIGLTKSGTVVKTSDGVDYKMVENEKAYKAYQFGPSKMYFFYKLDINKKLIVITSDSNSKYLLKCTK